MTTRILVRSGSYHDSARLMQVSRELSALPGIEEAVAMMGTETNRRLLAEAGFAGADVGSATPLDMIVGLRGDPEGAVAGATAARDRLLSGGATSAGGPAAPERPGTVPEALEARPAANLVSVAVPGPYAAFVAHRDLDAGRNVFLFSDNVAVADEVLDGPRSVVKHEAYNRLVAQMAVLHRLLAG